MSDFYRSLHANRSLSPFKKKNNNFLMDGRNLTKGKFYHIKSDQISRSFLIIS